jgi:hypothetical protein
MAQPHKGNKKVGRISSSDFGGLANQLTIPFFLKNRALTIASQAPKTPGFVGKNSDPRSPPAPEIRYPKFPACWLFGHGLA